MIALRKTLSTFPLFLLGLLSTGTKAQTTTHEWRREWLLGGQVPLHSLPNNTPDDVPLPGFATDFLQARSGEGNPRLSVGQVKTLAGGTAKWVTRV